MPEVISDIVGPSGRRILKAIVAGEANALKLAPLGSKHVKCSPSELIAALEGHLSDNHRFLIGQHLGMLEDLERRVEALQSRGSQRIADVLAPFCHLAALLMTVPGVSQVSAEMILAEIGFDMTPFPTAGHLVGKTTLHPGPLWRPLLKPVLTPPRDQDEPICKCSIFASRHAAVPRRR